MTCIRFFTHGAASYVQLGEQQVADVSSSRLRCSSSFLTVNLLQRWLVKAKEHLKAYLQEQQGRGAGRKRSSVISFRKTMSSSDVSRSSSCSGFRFLVFSSASQLKRFLFSDTSTPSSCSWKSPASFTAARAPRRPSRRRPAPQSRPPPRRRCLEERP